MRALVGREEELAALLRLLEPEGPTALTIVGPPGLGKSALVEAFVEAAAEAAREPTGRTLLCARPLETESVVSFTGLTDLLSGVTETMYDGLPPPQRAALRAVLLLDDAEQEVDPRAVAAALRGVVEMSPAPGLLLVVDDAQWLDAASSRALEQALAHARPDAARVLLATRPGGHTPSLPAGADQLVLPRLPEGALFHIVRQRLGLVLDRGALRALERASSGNPLHALELARAQGQGDRAGLSALVAVRIAAFPRATFLALLAATLAGTPTVEVVAAACRVEPRRLLDLLEPARQDGIIAVHGERIAFVHPLYASSCVESAASSDLREIHESLAGIESDEDRAVRHRALASTGPDVALADALERAADRTWRRGGWDAACDLLDLAADRTPDPDRRFDRMLALGKRLHLTGRPLEAERWLDEVRQHADGPCAWEAGVALGQILALSSRLDELRELVAELERAPLPGRLAAEVRLYLAPEIAGREPEVQLQLIASANELLDDLPDQEGLVRDRAAGLTAEFERRLVMGERRADLLERAAELERREPARTTVDGWVRAHAHDLLMGDRHDEARVLFEQLVQTCSDIGDDLSVPVLLTQSVHLEERAGRWDRAAVLLEEGRRSAVGQGQLYQVLFDIGDAKLRALQGDPDGAFTLLTATAPAVEAVDDHSFSAILDRVLGEVHLCAGNDLAAWQALSRAADSEDAARWHDPGGLLLLCSYVEAALAVGEVDAAVERTAIVQARAERLGERENVLAGCGYARLAVLAATDDLDSAVAAVPGVVAAYDVAERRVVERGRALLLAGRVYRRAKAKRLAASMLERAIEVFEALPCPQYAAQARDELARVGLRPRASAGLTPTEDQVARLAADGLRNHEIAARVFVSPRTVEAILGRVYRKLGIRSRTGLARAMDATGRD